MPDGLNNEERALAWKTAWLHSFDGWAIVNPDFTIRSANSVFASILGVTPAEIVGKRFSDFTAAEYREIDEANARLLLEGKINSYTMEKTYVFANGRRVDVILLVTRVPAVEDSSTEKNVLQFFLSRIVKEDKEELRLNGMSPTTSSPETSSFLNNVTQFFIDNYKFFVTLASVLFGLFMLWVEEMKKGH